MTNKIGIGIEAQFDAASVERQINALGQKIAAANKVQFTPFSGTTKSDLDKIVRQFEQLRKIHGELNKRMSATGQSGANLFNMDWDKLYADPTQRARQMRRAFEYSTGASFHAQVPPPQPPHGRRPQPTGSDRNRESAAWTGVGVQVAQSGLRAAGPAGGVAAGALGTGMSAGFGAGLMGLFGGILALGVGKIVGMATEKIGQAEDNSVAMDRLKRTIGDVNVSFDALKAVVHGGADRLAITYDEAGRLATQFAKLGNLSSDQYRTISDEMNVGVGMSRAFGLDPSQGVGVMGQMRGLGVTSSTQESRRFALLIGETIGKSGAFAKAEEVMDALASYTSTQTRNNMGVANAAGYAGMFSSMVGSGIPGLDPMGAAGVLSRINASLSGGGAHGEASQFFTALVGNSMGLDPIRTQILREGGAFATNDQMFGPDSAAGRFGLGGPKGGRTFLQASLEQLRRQYGGNKGLLAQATSNHLGIGINQAMAILGIEPNQIGEMQQYGDLNNLSGNGIGNLSKALYGSSADRRGLASTLMRRSDVSDADKAMLSGAMGTSNEREVLATLTAQYDQERTTGSDIRDSKNALDNVKTNIADKLVPMTQAIRDGILFMAGGGKKSRLDVMKEIEGVESQGRRQGIDLEYQNRLKSASEARFAAKQAIRDLVARNSPLLRSGAMTQAEHQAQVAPLMQREQAAIAADAQAREWHTEALEKETRLREDNIRALEEANLASQVSMEMIGVAPSGPGGRARAGRTRSGGRPYSTASGDYDSLFVKYGKQYGVDPALLKAIAIKESGLNPDAVSPMNANGSQDFGLMQHNSSYLGSRGLGDGAWASPERSVEEAAKLLSSNIRAAGSVRGGVRMYNGRGPRADAYADSVMSMVPGVTVGGTAIPGGPAGSGSGAGAGPLSGEVSVRLELAPDARRLLQQPAAPVHGRFGTATPFGTPW